MKSLAHGSVRRHLLIALLGGLALVWIIGGSISVFQMRNEVRGLLDENLKQAAAPLLHEVEEEAPDHAFAVFRFSSRPVFQVWRDGEQLQLRSKLAPEQRLSEVEQGFSDSEIAGQQWRVFSAWDDQHHYLVMVAQHKSERWFFLYEIVAQLIKSLVLVLPLFALMVWFVIGAVLRPLEQIGDEIAVRDAKNLSPLTFDVPREIEPLTRRLNELLRSLASTLDSERRFTGDAAHELRTPLAAVRSQIQVAMAAQELPQQQRALAQALQACDLATHRVEQMLTLARLEQEVWRENIAPFDLCRVAAQVIAEVAPLAHEKRVALVLDAEAEATLQARAGLWSILLRNLLDNAIRYTPADSTVIVQIEKSAGEIQVSVKDEGPGIAPEQLVGAFAPFNRLGRSDAEGCGLGLSIVARIVELHRARIELLPGENGRGLCARVRISVDAEGAIG
ncbi:MAG TPA: ATP-binding protein [Spongiibacteraceae bacterium]|nr:ATP-binding protein [Spongiibacteraceae bacterium]